MDNLLNRQFYMFLVLTLLLASNFAHSQITASEVINSTGAQRELILDKIEDEPAESDEEVQLSFDSERSGAVSNNVKLTANATIHLDIVSEEDNPLLPKQKIFELDENGALTIQNVGRVVLAGLSEKQAELRLSAEPLFEGHLITVTLLPLEVEGIEALRPFGEGYFSKGYDSDEQLSLSVPGSYIVGPGDNLKIQIYGSENNVVEGEINREGNIDLPQIGPVSVAGKSMSELKQFINDTVESQLTGSRAYVTIGDLRSISIVVAGEVKSPGIYSVGPMASVLDVLAASGGISEFGSYRSVELKKKNGSSQTIDLYDLMLQGKVYNNSSLEYGDVVFVGPVKRRAYVTGKINRPAIYELQAGETLSSLINIAGGLASDGWASNVEIERSDNQSRRLLVVDFAKSEGKNLKLNDGDSINVLPIEKELSTAIKLIGAVQRPGSRVWSKGLRVSDLFDTRKTLNRNADVDYALIGRFSYETRQFDVIPFSIYDALANKNTADDPALTIGDKVYVFPNGQPGARQHLLSPLIDEMLSLANHKRPVRLVNIEGGVTDPGVYPLTPNMRISNLVVAAGGLKQGPGELFGELSMPSTGKEGFTNLDHLNVDVQGAMKGVAEANLLLVENSTLVVKQNPRAGLRETIELTGEVRYPGVYAISRGEQLSNVIARAGGLTNMAFPDGVVLSRESVKLLEEQQMELLANRLETGLQATILERSDENLRPSDSNAVVGDLIGLLRSVEPIGRVVIDLPQIMNESQQGKISDADVTLMTGDRIHIPELQQAVTVVGEVNHPTSHLYAYQNDAFDYIKMSGDITSKSDEDLVYVVKANGSALKEGYAANVEPGDTVVVPLDVEKVPYLKSWVEVSAVVSNLVNPAASIVNAAAAWKAAEVLDQRTNP